MGKEGDDFNCYTMGEPDAECYVKDRKVFFSYKKVFTFFKNGIIL